MTATTSRIHLNNGHCNEVGDENTREGNWRGGSASSWSRGTMRTGTILMLTISMLLTTAAADCISLKGSTSCPAFQDAQVSNSRALQGTFPFLSFVSNTKQFDAKFVEYLKGGEYSKFKYQNLFGCNNITFFNTTTLYARYTQTVLCSRMIQDSKLECSLSKEKSKPVCADTCAFFARSEQIIASNEKSCGNTAAENKNIDDLIRSDYTICNLPADSLGESCVDAVNNEPANCGYADNLPGLCLYCAASSPDSTDTCCYNANAQARCQGVVLPTITNLPPLIEESPTGTPSTSTSSTSKPDNSKASGLSEGVIAGVSIGVLVAVGALVFLILFCWRRRRDNVSEISVFNQATRNPSMTFTTVNPATTGRGYEVLAGGRVARMSALEDSTSAQMGPPSPVPAVVYPRNANNSSSSDFGLEDSPVSQRKQSPQHRPLHPPPRGRNASLSSTSVLMDPSSPMTESEKAASSPEFAGSPQSEQLSYFKDYYSSDDIHPGDKVSTLWAYAPRAQDEFELERGDMIKVVGIWDDGWATGILLNERAEDHARGRSMRDSGVSASQTSHASQRRASSPPTGEVKAFPLVCVCLPEHWLKTIENETQHTDFRGSESGQSDTLQVEESPSSRRITEKSSSRFKDDLNVPRSPPSSSSP